jgi:hypothetical protein
MCQLGKLEITKKHLQTMKTNISLQASLRCSNPAQKVRYAAHVLKSACTSSPEVSIRKAVATIPAQPAVIAQTAKPLRPASLPVAAINNTTGFGFGELYLNSPAYPAGTAIPAITAKAASAAVVGKNAVAFQPAITAVSSPKVEAIKGYEDAIQIAISAETIIITAELPYAKGVGIVGSNKLMIGEITPSALQATAWVDSLSESALSSVLPDVSTDTMEQYFYRNALLCDHTITDVVRNVNGVNTSCKRVVVTLYPSTQFDPQLDSLQLNEVYALPNLGS